MQINRVPISEIKTNRLDPDYYKPEYLTSEKAVKDFGAFNLGDAGKLFAGPFGSKLPSKLYLDAGIPLFRIGNIGNMEAIPQNMAHLAPEVHQELKTSEVGAGDLLIVKASVSEKICKVPSNIEKANITQHIVALRGNGKYNTDYLMAFLFSRFGCHQLLRRSLGSIIQYLGISDTRNVSVPDVDDKVQTYIGDKVHHSELLREMAQSIESAVNTDLDSLLSPYEREPKKYAITNIHELEGRLDPRPYRSHYKSMVNEIKNHTYSEVGDIANLTSGDPVPSELFGQEGIPLIRIRNIGSNDFIDLDAWLPNDYIKNKQQYNARAGDIVVGMDGIFRAQFFIDYDLPARINQRVAIFRCHDIEPELLCFWLNRIEGQNQLNQWAVKTTVEHTSLDYISRIVIPRFDRTEENNLAKELNTRRRSTYLSKKCSEASKYIIEALIEGKITESQLIEAQQALENGDNSKDRAILSKLTDKGYLADDGKPLFSDLDKLYELLDEAKQAVDTGEESA
ncbi:restriction endonuclease subunit S [Pseudoalteromonas sp. SG44-5]|uniref:restriction endonuclease subunit S n=1 Tax=Pseudoalteromonas sp. SG44-5 TaxID=2760960 RepID=UPI0015FB051C|nr:restriction endonuclease subunit S [Pseudoalteromonas sp. SG44-5]MBB1404490.1 restriction endonuclease subunit S [Pseudoalteromonas sp. SG44-5]